ncbi:MAG: TIGR03545 family protein [bacterium]
MRPKGLTGLLVIVILVGITAYLLSDKFIERGIEKAGESIIGAKVEIDNLNFSLLGLSISLDRLQVANPNDTWKNLFETGRMSFDMEFTPLIRKKIIINDVSVADIRIGTERKTDGSISKNKTKKTPGWVDKASKSLMKQVSSAPVLNLDNLKKKVNVDSLIATIDIESIKRIEQIKQDADSSHQKWEIIISEFEPQKELENIEKQVNEIASKEVKGLDDLVSTLEKTKSVYKTLEELKKDIEIKKKTATKDFTKLTSVLTHVDNLIGEDFNAIKSKAKLGEFTSQNVGNMLFGEALALPTLGLLKYVSLVREYMPVAQQFAAAGKVEKPPRFKGQNIRFPLKNQPPDFLMEHILISGSTNQEDTSKVLYVSGEVNGITSQPPIYGQPLTFKLNAQLPQSKAYEIIGVFDHTKNIPEERFQIKASGIHIGRVALPERPYLPSRIIANRGDISTDFNFMSDQLEFRLHLTARPVSFSFPHHLTKDDVISKVTRGVFDSIDILRIGANIRGQINDLKLKISSNIDDILAKRINAVVGESIRLAQAEIRRRLKTLVEPKRMEALAFTNNRQKQISSEFDKIEKVINDKMAILDKKKKEIEVKVEKEKKKGIKKIIKKLKGIFKKSR